MTIQHDEFQKAWCKCVAKAWSEPSFKQKLLTEGQKTLKEQGFEIPSGIKFQVFENTDKVWHIPLPPKPSKQLSEEEMKQIMPPLGKEFQTMWSTIVKKAWADPKFKQTLLQNPMGVLTSHGAEIPNGVNCQIHENTEKEWNMVLAKQPSKALSEDELKKISGAFCCEVCV